MIDKNPQKFIRHAIKEIFRRFPTSKDRLVQQIDYENYISNYGDDLFKIPQKLHFYLALFCRVNQYNNNEAVSLMLSVESWYKHRELIKKIKLINDFIKNNNLSMTNVIDIMGTYDDYILIIKNEWESFLKNCAFIIPTKKEMQEKEVLDWEISFRLPAMIGGKE